MFRKNYLLKIPLIFLTIAFIFQNAFGQTETPFLLELSKPAEREITGDQTHEFKVSVAAGQYAKIIVEQRGINLFVRLNDGKGKIVTEADLEISRQGTEILEIYSAADDLRLSVAPRNKTSPAAAYKIEFVERRDPTAKDLALEEARKLWNDANSLYSAGKYAEALALAERCLAIRERELGAEHYEVARTYLVLGNIVGEMGDLDKNEFYYQKALKIAEKTVGKEHQLVAAVIDNWTSIYKLKGDYLKAEDLGLRALRIRENLFDPNHPQIASSMINLGNTYRLRGDTKKAAEYYRRALAIRENAVGPEHPLTATALNNLAVVTDDVAESEKLYLRALAIREKALGAEHRDVAESLYNLGRLYAGAGDYTKAETFAQRSLVIFEKATGAESQFVSYPVNLLAAIYKFKGDYDNAEKFFLRAVALKEKTQSHLHPELGGTLSNLMSVYFLKGDIEKALQTQKRANEISEYNALLNLRIGSEREKLAYMRTLEAIDNDTMTLNFRATANSPAIRDLALTTVLRHKGRVLDAMSDGFGVLRRRSDPQDQKLFDDLNMATTELVGFVTGEQSVASDDYRLRLKTLEEKREAIELQISRRSAGFYEASKPVMLNQVQSLIPQNAVLIEFAVYRPVSFKLSGFETDESPKAFEEPHYAVFVVDAAGQTHSRDLGTMREVNQLIDSLRQALRDPKRTDVKQIARRVDEKLMQPIRAVAGKRTHLLLSPDGALNLIPFEALVDENGKYLIENHSFSYLTSGRDLLRMQMVRASKDKSVILANPNFGVPSTEQVATISAGQEGKRNSVTTGINLADTYFAPLSATMLEGRAIHELFPESQFLTGAQATEITLKQLVAPRLLHIATHGFFLQDANSQKENPLVRSGLALTGANQHKSGADDGILTALEASALNLWGTKLVVLSACDTGLGDVKNGEGVYGLRRAFTLAGAETLMMSLWEVSDAVTRELMTNYYKNLKDGKGRSESLRNVQLEMMKKKGREHPFYWAAFIQSGEWANLEGKR